MWCKLHTLILSERPHCPVSMRGNRKCLKSGSFIEFSLRGEKKVYYQILFFSPQPNNYKPQGPNCTACILYLNHFLFILYFLSFVLFLLLIFKCSYCTIFHHFSYVFYSLVMYLCAEFFYLFIFWVGGGRHRGNFTTLFIIYFILKLTLAYICIWVLCLN